MAGRCGGFGLHLHCVISIVRRRICGDREHDAVGVEAARPRATSAFEARGGAGLGVDADALGRAGGASRAREMQRMDGDFALRMVGQGEERAVATGSGSVDGVEEVSLSCALRQRAG